MISLLAISTSKSGQTNGVIVPEWGFWSLICGYAFCDSGSGSVTDFGDTLSGR